ncbi:hypothetical protein, partial [Thermoflexus sp.]|uniref:hypothetical protein n=1 Tax=Thermoflexus sp. TaxID=1969742 RepID=UPI002ADDAEF1
GIGGAVLEVEGRRITTGPDGRFPLSRGTKARLLTLPLRGQLTVADGVMFGVQPLDRPWWLLGLALGMILFAVSWALDPRPKEIWRWTKILREGGMR